MPQFAYSAVDTAGKTIRGVLDAETEQMLLQKLHDQHLHVTDIKAAKSRGVASKLTRGKKVKLKSIVVMSRQFATMIDAGIPMLRCLEILTSPPSLTRQFLN